MNKKEWINHIKNNRQLSLPVLSFPAVQLLNITVKDLVSDSTLQAKAMDAIAHRYSMSASLSMMDLSVEAEAFGAEVRYFDMDVPTVIKTKIETMEDVDNLLVPEIGTGRTKTYIEGIRQAKSLITDIPVFAGVIGPFSLSGRLMDMTEIMVNCYINPEMVHETLTKASLFIKNYILKLKAAGADGVIMAEPAAGLLSPEICQEFSSRYIADIVKDVNSDDFVFIYHNCGNVIPLVDTMLSIKADIYHFGDAINMENILRLMPADTVVMGNLSPSSVFQKGTVQSVKDETNHLLEKCSIYENFIISSGCDIPPLTPIENIDAYFETVSSFYK
ncbi:MAG: uroporphyrinogen decarboxylase family protein [Candidatus Izemoplasmatales bacterium]|jgi:uroporphyrinogen decarboxylase|nr:uroporphyrinogen decarboxylase family protein [Candidatus Izemoplasmatales bacterium]